MEKPLVSLLTPCYNTAKYIHRLLDSVLNQTYSNIEMFVIDDGSTDNSAEVIKGYINKFQNKGFSLTYVHQENSGQSVAIKNGLAYINGKYLAWPDSDDFYAADNAIEKMVDELEKSSEEFAMVRTMQQILDENTLQIKGYNGNNVKHFEDKTLFEDCLFAKNGYFFVPGSYMADVQALKSSFVWPIYAEKNAGQNWQLMLPILWNYKCISINEVLYSVLCRKSSHSRGQYKGYEQTVVKITTYRNTIIETLNKINNMNADLLENYKAAIYKKYDGEFRNLAFQYGKRKDFYTLYEKQDQKTKKDKFMFILVKFRLSILYCQIDRLYFAIKRRILKLFQS